MVRLIRLSSNTDSLINFFFKEDILLSYYEKEFFNYNKIIHWETNEIIEEYIILANKYSDRIIPEEFITELTELMSALKENYNTAKIVYSKTKILLEKIIIVNDFIYLYLEIPHEEESWS